jgi:hypothetical protein
VQDLNEDQIVEIEIDLEQLKKNEMNESFLGMFGSQIKLMLSYMFREPGFSRKVTPFYLRGSEKDVESFARALGNEKKYIETAKKHGLDNPTTYKSKTALTRAVKAFERQTGIKWPFK